MNIRRSIFAAPVAVAVLSLLSACSDEANPAPANSGGAPAAGTSAASGGFGGLGAAGVSAGGVSAGGIGGSGSGGASTGGVSGGGAGTAAGASGSGSAVPATFETVTTVINQAPCFGAGCHNDDQNPLNLRVDDQLHARLTARISVNCGNIPVVNPGRPQESALVKILKGPCTPTPRMPLGCVDDQDATCIPPEYIAAIEQWIASGAPQP